MRRPASRTIRLPLVFSLTVVGWALIAQHAAALGSIESLPTEAEVRRVVDGDTIELRDGRLVRYIGIDAPESRRRARPGDREWRAGEGARWVADPEPFAEAATEANRHLVAGRRVRLEYDVQTHDRFGRLLAYVYVGDTMVNAQLLREGMAQLLTIPPDVTYAAHFRALAEEAREARRGLWKDK